MRQKGQGSSALHNGGHNTEREFGSMSDIEWIGNWGKLGQIQAPIQLEWCCWAWSMMDRIWRIASVCVCHLGVRIQNAILCWHTGIYWLGYIIYPHFQVLALDMSTTTGMSICFCYKIIYLSNKLPASKFSNNVYYKRTRKRHYLKFVLMPVLMPNFGSNQLINKNRVPTSPLFILHHATPCTLVYTQVHRKAKSMSENLFKSGKYDQKKITSPFCHCQFVGKVGPYFWDVFHPLVKNYFSLYITTLTFTKHQVDTHLHQVQVNLQHICKLKKEETGLYWNVYL